MFQEMPPSVLPTQNRGEPKIPFDIPQRVWQKIDGLIKSPASVCFGHIS